MEHEALLVRPEQHELLLAARPIATDGYLLCPLHRFAEQAIGLVASLVRAEVISLRYVNPVDRARFDELDDLEAVRLGGLERVELFFGEEHVLVLRVLVSFDEVVAFDELVVRRAEYLLFDPALALRVDEVEADGFRGG